MGETTLLDIHAPFLDPLAAFRSAILTVGGLVDACAGCAPAASVADRLPVWILGSMSIDKATLYRQHRATD